MTAARAAGNAGVPEDWAAGTCFTGARCACGATFVAPAGFMAHALEICPPRAAAPLDDQGHGPAPFRPWQPQLPPPGMTRQPYTTLTACTGTHRVLAGLAGYGPLLPEPMAADLDALAFLVNAWLQAWDYQGWAFSRLRYLRFAAVLAHQVTAGTLEPGTTIRSADLCDAYRVSAATTARALARLRERGILTSAGGRSVVPFLRAWPPAPATEAS